jgi:VIT1/CCC1 family predicted Fe2+/Mn2+ transporter
MHDSKIPMSKLDHVEHHFTSGEIVRDVVIGMSDGLTVPFALAAGLSGAVSSTSIILTAGLAEIVAGAIAMGLGGYLAAKSDTEHYASERRREEVEIVEMNDEEVYEVTKIFQAYGLADAEIAPIVRAFQARPREWVDFMMRFELGLEKPEAGRAARSALTIASAYIAGGLIPLAPYFPIHHPPTALLYSVGVTLTALLIFGFIKGRFTGSPPLRSSLQTALIGGLAAGAAFFIARAIS